MENGYQGFPLTGRQSGQDAADSDGRELTAAEVRDGLALTQKGQTANTNANCMTVFRRDPLLKGAICLNLLTERIDIVREPGWRRDGSTLTDTDLKYLFLYFEETYGLTNEKKIQNALAIAANKNCCCRCLLRCLCLVIFNWGGGLAMKEIPIWEKSNLNLEEAAAYSGIGVNKLREITNDEKCTFVLWVGNKRLIKRRLFDEYIEQSYSI